MKVKVGVGESGKGNDKVKGGHNVLPVNLLPYLAEAYLWQQCIQAKVCKVGLS